MTTPAVTPARLSLVCDLTLASAGTPAGLRAPVPADAVTAQYTFSDMDAARASAIFVVTDGPAGRESASMAVEAGAIVFLVERAGASKTIVTVQTRPDVTLDWPAVLTQHAWIGGEVMVRTAIGACRARPQRP